MESAAVNDILPPPSPANLTPYEQEHLGLMQSWGTSPEQAQAYLRYLRIPETNWDRVLTECGDAWVRAHIVAARGNKPRLIGVLACVFQKLDAQYDHYRPPYLSYVEEQLAA